MSAISLAGALVLGLALADVGAARAQAPDSLGAGWGQQQNQARQGERSGALISLAQVIERIRRRTPGRHLDAGLEQMGPRAVYRIRWMTTDGRRIDYIVDAATGEILSGN